MKIIDWNMSYQNNCIDKIQYLKSLMLGFDVILCLQEVTPSTYKDLKEELEENYHIEYSLNYRKPGKYDTKSRKLGVAIITSKTIQVKKAFIIERALFPDRTLIVDLVYDNQNIRVLSFHSITGCSYKKAKSIQFFSMTEAVDELKPDIIGMDINEPKFDHYNINKMIFFDNGDKGNGIRTFLNSIEKNELADSLLIDYDITKYEEEKPLTISHIINNKLEKRYDFIFLNKNKLKKYETKYDYENAIKAGSDHASIIVTIKN